MKIRRVFIIAGATFAALALAGCSRQIGAYPGASKAKTASIAPSTPAVEAGMDATVATTILGKVVVDGKGMTAYFFDKDKANSGSSACTGQCEAIWPAITSTSTTPSVTGITGNIGTIVGVAGERQVTISGRPIYTYAYDTVPGDTNGQGILGIWFVISPSGGEIKSVGRKGY